MSLFASAFDSPAGPSTSTLSSVNLGKPHKDGKNKNKRSSLPGSAAGPKQGKRPQPNGQHDIRATEANLAKLMKKVEAGEVKGKREGGESMGGSRGKKGKGGDHSANQGQGEGERPLPGGGGKKRKRDPIVSGQAQESPKRAAPPTAGAAKVKKGDKPAPAELPLPHTIPKSDLHVESVKDEKLTDMQRSMQAKLEGARFRWINEQLYSNPSDEAVAMMKKEPKIFEDYHQTHRALTSAWPSPPLPHLINLLTPLPSRTLIVDLGCGDAGLAKALVPQGKIVLSYDLVGDSGNPSGPGAGAGAGASASGSTSGGWVCEADFLTHVPLPGRPGGLSVRGANTVEAVGEMSKSQKRRRKAEKARDGTSEMVDVVVCCLSLMGTNWVGGIYEACRILKQGGTLHIAEVTSRFVSTEAFTEKVCSFGFTLDDEKSPSTHFTLFRFTKEADVPLGPARGERGWEERVREGEGILRGCVYKKR